MGSVINVFKIVLNLVKIVGNFFLIPIPFIIDVVIAVPQTIIAQLNAHRKIIIILCFAIIYGIGLHCAFPDMKLYDALIWIFKSGQFKTKAGLMLFIVSIAPAILLRWLIGKLDRLFDRFDDFLYRCYSSHLHRIIFYARNISDSFHYLCYGTQHEWELYEMDWFKTRYGL